MEMARGRCLRDPSGRDLRSVRQLPVRVGAGELTMPTSTKDLEFYDLTHRWGHGMPQWPSRANLNVRVVEFHAKDGLLVQQFEGIMHRGTHMDAPIHVQENQLTLTGYPLWRFFGTGVVVSIRSEERRVGKECRSRCVRYE